MTSSEEETQDWAKQFAQCLHPGDVLALQGGLGAGKTVFCRGLARGLGFLGDVHSPSYALVHEYPHHPPIYHIDLYRLGPQADWQEIGLDYYAFGSGITLIEWPERLESLDVGIRFWVRIEALDVNRRQIVVSQKDRNGI